MPMFATRSGGRNQERGPRIKVGAHRRIGGGAVRVAQAAGSRQQKQQQAAGSRQQAAATAETAPPVPSVLFTDT